MMFCFFFSSRRRHTRCALVTGVQTCALPIYPVEHLKFIADQGFRAAFDLGMVNRPPEQQEKIANEAARLGLEMGQFSLKIDFSGSTFVLQDKEVREMLKKKLLAGQEVQKRTGINQALVVLGRYDQKMHWDYQTANVIENLRMYCDMAEKTDRKSTRLNYNH